MIVVSGAADLIGGNIITGLNCAIYRDIVLVDVIIYLMEMHPECGLYNLGTRKASNFLDLADYTFQAMDLEPSISFVDTPVDILDHYQYFTEAKMDKLRKARYDNSDFTSLDAGIKKYVCNYLMYNSVN